MFSTRYAIGAVLAAAILVALPGSVRAGRDLPTNFLDEPIKKWREGPIRYFLTGDEDSTRHAVMKVFKTPLGAEQEISPGVMDIAHTGKLLLAV